MGSVGAKQTKICLSKYLYCEWPAIIRLQRSVNLHLENLNPNTSPTLNILYNKNNNSNNKCHDWVWFYVCYIPKHLNISLHNFRVRINVQVSVNDLPVEWVKFQPIFSCLFVFFFKFIPFMKSGKTFESCGEPILFQLNFPGTILLLCLLWSRFSSGDVW